MGIESQFEHTDSALAAIVDEGEAARIADELWASHVESRIAAVGTEQLGDVVEDVVVHPEVVVIEFSRDQQAFDHALLNSPPAARALASGGALQPAWANGAKIFVPAICHEDVQEAGVELRPRHVVAYEADLPEILHALEQLPSQSRPRLKPTRPVVAVPVPGDVTLFGDATSQDSNSRVAESIASEGTSDNVGVASSKVPLDRLLPQGFRIKIKFTFITVEGDDEFPQSARTV